MSAAQPGRDANRVVRGVLLPLASLALTWSAHTVAGGHSGDLVVVTLPLLLTSTAGTLLADRSSSRLGMWAALLVTQLVSHLFLTLTSHHAGDAGESGQMLAGHVLAAAVLALLLTHAERLLAAARRLLPRPLAPYQPHTTDPPTSVSAGAPGDVTLLLLRHVCTRRGPPVLPEPAIP